MEAWDRGSYLITQTESVFVQYNHTNFMGRPDVYCVSADATMTANGIEACDKHIPTGPIRLVQRLKSSADI